MMSVINCVRGWCISNFMKLNVNKTTVISFSRKMNLCLFDYKLCESLITWTECIKDLGVQIDSELHFHHHVDYIFSQAVRLLGLIRTVTSSFSSLQSLLMLYYTLVRPKLEYASVVWNSITCCDASKLQRIQWKFASLCHHRFFSHLPYSYTNVLNYLKFHTLSDLRCHLDALFLLNVFSGSKFCPTLLETVSLRVSHQNFRDFKLFHVDFSCRNCPSARCTSATNGIGSDSCTFNCTPVLINSLLPGFRV
jgi:hypothetical protein